ncbi:uncharacterized protein LOC127709500 [Mytilus californianus]|uniref:uncharacterized protein LOC127709500 n=1 Tax=Mytilus californianus TaxID=6549 RepID=UPI0022484281|nr:uncharacterized protein LOC127709500 [Mytilus californianus]
MEKATFLFLLGLGVVSFYEADAICSISCSWIGKTFIRIEDNANFKFSCEDTSTYTMSLGNGKSSTEQCVWLSGAFLVVRRNQHEYRCWKITHDDNVHVSTFVTPWRFFKQPPATICDVCGGFQKKAIIHFVQGSKPNKHTIERLSRGRIGCNRPKHCPIVNPHVDCPCQGCENPQNEEGMCCPQCQKSYGSLFYGH